MKLTKEKWFWIGFIPLCLLVLLTEGIIFYFANLAVVGKNDWFLGIMIYAVFIFIFLITAIFFPKFIKYKEEIMLGEKEITKRWKMLDIGFKRACASLIRLLAVFGAYLILFGIISLIDEYYSSGISLVMLGISLLIIALMDMRRYKLP